MLKYFLHVIILLGWKWKIKDHLDL